MRWVNRPIRALWRKLMYPSQTSQTRMKPCINKPLVIELVLFLAHTANLGRVLILTCCYMLKIRSAKIRDTYFRKWISRFGCPIRVLLFDSLIILSKANNGEEIHPLLTRWPHCYIVSTIKWVFPRVSATNGLDGCIPNLSPSSLTHAAHALT